jgi:hypothetical protein
MQWACCSRKVQLVIKQVDCSQQEQQLQQSNAAWAQAGPLRPENADMASPSLVCSQDVQTSTAAPAVAWLYVWMRKRCTSSSGSRYGMSQGSGLPAAAGAEMSSTEGHCAALELIENHLAKAKQTFSMVSHECVV